jgi:hypothetical protein
MRLLPGLLVAFMFWVEIIFVEVCGVFFSCSSKKIIWLFFYSMSFYKLAMSFSFLTGEEIFLFEGLWGIEGFGSPFLIDLL